MRISYNPQNSPTKEGYSALHAAAQAGKTDLVRYLLAKGVNPQLVEANGKKAIDLVAAGGGLQCRGRGAPAPAAVTGNIAAPADAQASGARPAGGRGGAGGTAVSPATVAEIRALLQNPPGAK